MAMIDLDSLVEDVAIVDRDEAAREEWLQKRAGRITCSRFGDLIGEGKAKDALFTRRVTLTFSCLSLNG